MQLSPRSNNTRLMYINSLNLNSQNNFKVMKRIVISKFRKRDDPATIERKKSATPVRSRSRFFSISNRSNGFKFLKQSYLTKINSNTQTPSLLNLENPFIERTKSWLADIESRVMLHARSRNTDELTNSNWDFNE